MARDDSCIFCQIVGGAAPAHRIWESDTHLAFLSIFPNTQGFSVVVPKQHHPSYAFALPDRELAELVLAAKQVGRLLDRALGVARTGMMFEGYGVDHAHAKLFPMHGTGTDSAFRKLSISRVDKYFERYEGYLSSHDGARADDAELAALAARIRACA